ncbi:MAG TPA: S53 family peptidase [Solirubrobacteraceae bacterium]|jgi:subtilase family serine protease
MKRAGTSLIAAAAVATALFALAATASAYPVTGRIAPHAFVAAQAPPSTQDCRTQLGISCYSPNQLQTAYDLKPLYANGLTGKGRTIVIVDSFGSPTIADDLHQFDSDFGLPDPPSLKVIQPAGAVPPFDGTNDDMVGWAFETTLDVEYAHSMAPGANILLVETPVAETEGVTGFPEIVKAENYVINHNLGDVITQSFGATEETFPSKASIFGLRSAYQNAALRSVTVLASSGDTGSTDYKLNGVDVYDRQVNSWPSSDPLVTSLGGTQLHLDEAGNREAPDNVWNDIPVGIDAAGGGGPSHVFPRPIFQLGTRTGSGLARATPDISMSAAVDGGVLVYLTFPGLDPGYYIVGGTSEASPLFSGVVAIADQIAGRRLGWINPRLYALGSNASRGVVDVTSGDNTFTLLDEDGNPVFTVPGFTADRGYDMASGLGTVDAARFTHALAGR